MKYYFFTILLIGNSLYSQPFFEKQIQLRNEKPIYVYTGLNSISYYYSIQLLGASYAFDSKNEIGANFIFSKYSSDDRRTNLPSTNTLFLFNENYAFKQNSMKIFYNYYIFNSPFFVNATLGSLPEVSQTYSAFIIPTFSNNFSEFNINVRRKSTAYFSPGLGLKLILDNGVFFTISGGPMFIYDNQIRSNSYSYLASNSDSQNIAANLFINPLIDSKKKELFGFSKKNTEAYIDFSAGISF
ncbi:hypothetical protein EHQ46_06000 [Leptospira yanagawae]|uniref:Outer membrane protein beta-barrel domain-containing protein n=1 Tax=Leptospira yanagawae TaxID=293069 RepID=A0ABY2M3I1_9LEPT|nr:hypothetical protein [Leptospira yanagawae]TGL23067.1 hypothetical protein EHQ46_06000 [Leptospira yanagawae]